MRKVNCFIVLAALVAMTSCQKEQVSNGIVDNSIAFGVAGIGADMTTKAYSENTASVIETNGFIVAGVNGTSSMFNEKATKSSSVYKPINGPYYYPASGKMDFYAVYPVSQAITVASGAATLVYSQNVDTDLLAAKKAQVSASDNAVALTFDHVLSLLKFKAVGSDSKVVYKLKSVKVTAPDGGTYAYASGAWTNNTTTQDYTYSSTTTTLSGTTSIAGAITVVPCIPTVKVIYDTYAADGTTLIASYEKSAALASATTIGKECTITLTLPNSSAKEISFSVSVNTWGTEDKTLSF